MLRRGCVPMNETPMLSHEIRLDSLPLNQSFFTPEGYFRDRPILTSTGIFEYSNPDGSVRRELRLPEDVFDAESLKSYKGKPVIVTHDAGLVTKDNVSQEQIGTILTDGYRSGDDVRAEIIIHDTDEMKRSGLKELSLGYNLDLEETPGVWNGQPYDAIQRNIRINHLALVREARAGDQARLNIDSREPKKILKGGKMDMSKAKNPTKARRADGVLSPEDLKKAIEAYQAKKANRVAAKADEGKTDPEVVETTPETAADSGCDNASVEEQVAAVKDRRDRRDAEGEPETVEQAQGIIANQDDDMDILFDIIDTLLAKADFDSAEPAPAEAKEGEEETPATAADEGEEGEPEEKPETAEDEEDEEKPTEENADGEGEEENEEKPKEAAPAPKAATNSDSVDEVVRQRIKIGMLGRTLNIDGLEDMPMRKAKIAIIKAVRPNVRLDGKSDTYIQAMYDIACGEAKAKTTKDINFQKKQMFNGDGRIDTAKNTGSSAAAARQRMIERRTKKEEN